MSHQKSLRSKFEMFDQTTENILASYLNEYLILFSSHFLQILFFEPPFILLE